MFPDFIGIGAQKAGTTWLHRNLQAHPQLYMPRKEVHYFDRKIRDRTNPVSRFFGKRDIDVQWRRQVRRTAMQLVRKPSLRDLVWNFNYYMKPYNDRWYSSVFEPKDGRVAGEITPAYSALDRERVAHVHDLVPDAKIIFMMRNPIERPWSAMDMRLRIRGQEVHEVKDRKFYRRFDNKGSRLRTDYLGTLERWGAFYPEEQIFVGFLEDVRFFPQELLRSLYSFLGVDPSFEHGHVTRKVHPGQQDTIPTRFAVHLAHAYHEQIKALDERFGGYASFWLHCTQMLIEAPPQEDLVPHPLWESPLWEEWEGSREIIMSSGPLSSVRAAS